MSKQGNSANTDLVMGALAIGAITYFASKSNNSSSVNNSQGNKTQTDHLAKLEFIKHYNQGNCQNQKTRCASCPFNNPSNKGLCTNNGKCPYNGKYSNNSSQSNNNLNW
jgi:hypothetical protein